VRPGSVEPASAAPIPAPAAAAKTSDSFEGGARPDTLSRLPAELAAKLGAERVASLQVLRSGPDPAGGKDPVTALLGVSGLSASVQLRAFETLAEAPIGTALHLEEMLALPQVQALTPAQQLTLIELASSFRGSGALTQIAARSPTVLFDRDANGQTLLENLTRFAERLKVLPPGMNGNALSAGLLSELADPGNVRQGYYVGTCTVATLNYMIARYAPSEYLRLMTGLLSEEGRVKTRDGAELVRVPNSIDADPSRRSPGDRIFQAALMEYGNGMATYDAAADRNRLSFLPFIQNGLTNDGVMETLVALFGRKASTLPIRVDLTKGKLGAVDLSKPPDPAPIIEYLRAHPNGPGVLALMDFGSGHAVTVTRVEGDRVYLHNPWGEEVLELNGVRVRLAEPGEEVEHPRRRVEDTKGGSSMTMSDFLHSLNVAIALE
jgi:hypothetical protein